MKTWRLAHGPLRCGNCRAAIAKGQPFLEYRITASRTLVRCQACGESMTGEPVPDSLEDDAPTPVSVAPQPSLSGLEPIGAVGERAWRRRLRRA